MGIHFWILKKTVLINQLRMVGCRDGLKEANITPIFKKDDSFDKSNYRSVSILLLLSKVYERLTLECQKNIPSLVNFWNFPAPQCLFRPHPRYLLFHILFTLLYQNWQSQYKHSNIKISVIKYEENM